MKNYIFLILFLCLVKSQVYAQYNDNNDGGFAENEAETNGREDHFNEKAKKWDIDLADMLNFDKYEVHSINYYRKETTTEEEYEETGQGDEEIAFRGNEKPNKQTGEYPLERPTDGNGNEAVGDIKNNEESKNLAEVVNSKAELDSFKSQVKEYFIRYVNLLLFSVNLKDKTSPEMEKDIIKINLDFVISKKDLATLQNLPNDLNGKNIIEKLYEVDHIMSDSLFVKEQFSFLEDLLAFFKKSEFTKELLKSKNAYFLIFGTTALFMISVKNLAGFSYKFIVIVLINNMIVLEGIFSYWMKLKEATIADHVEKLKYKAMPMSCNPEERTLFDKVYDWFVENECLNYHKTMQMSKADKIFPLESVMHAYTFYLLEMPLKIFGSGMRAFIVSVNEYLPWMFRPFGSMATQYLLLGFLILLALLLMGPTLKLHFMGAWIELGFDDWLRNRRRRQVEDETSEYHRIRHLSRAAIRDMEKDYVQQQPDYLAQGSDSVSEVDKESVNTEHSEVDENRVEENSGVEIVNEDVKNDNVSLVSEERNLSQDITIAKRLLAELKSNE